MIVLQVSLLTDIVINATPSNVPYSLMVLKNLWSDRVLLYVKCYTHSSLQNLTDEAKAFVDAIETKLEEDDIKSNPLPVFKVALIWKNGSNFNL